ncbi:Type 1 glutamine amidotransferase-like domain-containing protein [Parasphingorhabdus sp.]|uniref:Type 1 glutamine amidotransferase-like domain-containing protein n=1 Tax=Parasphingorhabdus sp. TaxID=2709688 RepID=UPI0032650151
MAVRRIFGLCDSASFFVPENVFPVFGHKLVELSGKNKPVVSYIGAAKGDQPERIADFCNLAERVGAEPRILSLYDPPTRNADSFFEGVDAIYVDGGSTRNLLALLKEWNVIEPLLQAYQQGVLLSGASAGLNILFEWCITDSVKSEMDSMAGLGVVQGAICVHHDSSTERQKSFREYLRGENAVFPAYALDDGIVVYFENEQLCDSFSAAPAAGLRAFSEKDGALVTRDIPAALLNPV